MDVFLWWTKAIALIIGLGIEIGAGLFVLATCLLVVGDYLCSRLWFVKEFLLWYRFKRYYPTEYLEAIRQAEERFQADEDAVA